MLRTSLAAVVLGCFYFCPLDCDASVMVFDCAAVETGCMLKKYINYFSVSATTTFLCVYSIAVAAVEKGYAFLFFGRGAAAANHCSLGCAAAAGAATTTAVSFASILLLLLLRRDIHFVFWSRCCCCC